MDSLGIAPRSSACGADVFLLDHDPSRRKPWDSNPQVALATNCFQDSVLIRPDDFRLAAGVGIEPTSRRSERPVLPLDDPAKCFLVPGLGIEPTNSCDQRCASVPESGITTNSDDPGVAAL